jgi:hypothetical protein
LCSCFVINSFHTNNEVCRFETNRLSLFIVWRETCPSNLWSLQTNHMHNPLKWIYKFTAITWDKKWLPAKCPSMKKVDTQIQEFCKSPPPLQLWLTQKLSAFISCDCTRKTRRYFYQTFGECYMGGRSDDWSSVHCPYRQHDDLCRIRLLCLLLKSESLPVLAIISLGVQDIFLAVTMFQCLLFYSVCFVLCIWCSQLFW